jgi:hypothetical protein
MSNRVCLNKIMATGKISRLPREIREQVNQRLDDGVPGKRLVAWLNELPEVRALLASEFGGAAINEQNLTNWKQGGFREWRMREEARVFVESASGAEVPPVVTTEQLSTVVAARYLVAVREWQQSSKPEERRFRRWRMILQDVMKLRGQELSAKRLALDWERLEWRQKTQARQAMVGMLREMETWPEVRSAFQEAFGCYERRKTEEARMQVNEAKLGQIKVNQGEQKIKFMDSVSGMGAGDDRGTFYFTGDAVRSEDRSLRGRKRCRGSRLATAVKNNGGNADVADMYANNQGMRMPQGAGCAESEPDWQQDRGVNPVLFGRAVGCRGYTSYGQVFGEKLESPHFVFDKLRTGVDDLSLLRPTFLISTGGRAGASRTGHHAPGAAAHIFSSELPSWYLFRGRERGRGGTVEMTINEQ